jgi:hypothetical protein
MSQCDTQHILVLHNCVKQRSGLKVYSLYEAIKGRERAVQNVHIPSQLASVARNIEYALSVHMGVCNGKHPKPIKVPWALHDGWPDDAWYIEFKGDV